NHLLPQLSRLPERTAALARLARFGAWLVPAFILAGAVLYFIRAPVILIVYSRQFLPGSDLVLPQLTGDTLKVAALLLHYYFMSRGRVTIVFASELIQGGSLYLFYLGFAPAAGLSAPVYAGVATYACLVVLMLVLVWISGRRSGFAAN